MARKIVHLPAVAPEEWDTSGVGVVGSQAAFAAIRDAMRTDLAALGVKVSDIGIRTSGTYTCMLFEAYDTTNNVSMYCIGGYSSATNAPDIDDYLGQTGTNLRTRAKAFGVAFASASTNPAAGLTWGVNPDTTISRADLDFDDVVNLTYAGGDFTALTTVNPDSLTGLQAIFPSHCTYAMTTDVQGTYRVSHCVGYDSTAGVWQYMLSGNQGNQSGLAMWGATLDPSAGGDTNEYGTVYVWGTTNTYTDLRGINHQHAEVNAFDPGGTSSDYDLSPKNTLTDVNYKITGGADDGKLNWKKVEVNNGTGGAGIKGDVKEALFVEIGIYRDGQFKLRPIQFPDAANPVICYTESCAIWWEDGGRMFPSYNSYNR